MDSPQGRIGKPLHNLRTSSFTSGLKIDGYVLPKGLIHVGSE
ncbi:MAG TPA: hypothetical protein PK839_10390 [Tenuifilaceae bacterium]|nr:hypothetical protein [Tenuifilaceae bacterium]HOC37533.1 hypothetical protein [Tenuifilaceae bacterium]HOG73184.1 hypothetical protein [Tenuifilaceae bacterium]HPH01277.1 hypothetical protein [Tenuifilaceae bacterium]HPS05237.1 hypothetical protein [Tenuifilaceae bacterium]